MCCDSARKKGVLLVGYSCEEQAIVDFVVNTIDKPLSGFRERNGKIKSILKFISHSSDSALGDTYSVVSAVSPLPEKEKTRVAIDNYMDWHPIIGDILLYRISQTGGPEKYGRRFDVSGFADFEEAETYAKERGWIIER